MDFVSLYSQSTRKFQNHDDWTSKKNQDRRVNTKISKNNRRNRRHRQNNLNNHIDTLANPSTQHYQDVYNNNNNYNTNQNNYNENNNNNQCIKMDTHIIVDDEVCLSNVNDLEDTSYDAKTNKILIDIEPVMDANANNDQNDIDNFLASDDDIIPSDDDDVAPGLPVTNRGHLVGDLNGMPALQNEADPTIANQDLRNNEIGVDVIFNNDIEMDSNCMVSNVALYDENNNEQSLPPINIFHPPPVAPNIVHDNQHAQDQPMDNQYDNESDNDSVIILDGPAAPVNILPSDEPMDLDEEDSKQSQPPPTNSNNNVIVLDAPDAPDANAPISIDEEDSKQSQPPTQQQLNARMSQQFVTKFVTYKTSKTFDEAKDIIDKSPAKTDWGSMVPDDGCCAGILCITGKRQRLSFVLGSNRYNENNGILNDLGATVKRINKGAVADYYLQMKSKPGFEEWLNVASLPFNNKPSDDLVVDEIYRLVIQEGLVHWDHFIRDYRQYSCTTLYVNAFKNAVKVKAIMERELTDLDGVLSWDLYPWQKIFQTEISTFIDKPTCDRFMRWIYCNGGSGKSSLVSRMKAEFPNDVVVISRLMDAKDICEYFRNKQFVKVVLVDLTRVQDLDNVKHLMAPFESLKNRNMSCSKYNSGEILMCYYVYLLFLANEPPKVDWWTWDRFNVKQLVFQTPKDPLSIEIKPYHMPWTNKNNCPPECNMFPSLDIQDYK